MTGHTAAAPTVVELLDFEDQHHQDDVGHRTEAVRHRFGLPYSRYVQLLGRAIETREAAEHHPILTRLLLTRRTTRADARATRVGRTPRPG